MAAVAVCNVVVGYLLIQSYGAPGLAVAWVAIEWLAAALIAVSVRWTSSKARRMYCD